jgi:hypothetical protein
MNNLRLIPLTLIALFLASCSNSDDNNDNGPITGNFFPSTIGDLWTYDVEGTNSNDSNLNFSETDFIGVGTSQSNNFTLIANNNISPASGVMNALLVDGILTKGESTLNYSGNLELPAEFADFSNTEIPLQNILLYDLNASTNEILSEVSGSFSQNLDLDGDLLPLTITYTLTTKKISLMNSLNVNGETFSNVFRGELNLSMKVVTPIDLLGLGNPVDYDLLATQDVITIENYFAKDIGLIKSEAIITYELDPGLISILNDLSIDLGIPEDLTLENTQEIVNYLISE